MIYFIRDEAIGFIKIGTAGDPARRLAALQTGNPHPLALIGVLPGGPAEEKRLHRQFGWAQARGEWFRGDPDLCRAVGLLLARSGRPATVADELHRRRNCRYGLSGLAVVVAGSEGIYRVHGTRWDAGEELALDLCPDGGPGPLTLWREAADEETLRDRDLGLYEAADWRGTDYPDGSLRGVPAGDCVLLEPWPHACCTPD